MMIPYKAPHLLCFNVQDEFYGIVNTWYPDSLRIINKIQFKVIERVDGYTSIENIAKDLNLQVTDISKMIDLLSHNELVSFNDKFSAPKELVSPKSLDLWIHTTNRCNLSCNYCYISTLNSSGGMSLEVMQQLTNKLVDTAIGRNLHSIKLRLAGGEPLTQFNHWKNFIIDTKRKLENIGCNFSVSYITNLTLLNDDIIQFAKEQNIGFGISLDGVGLYHDATRKLHSGKGSFELVDNNIQLLQQNNIKFSISSVITNFNMQGLPALTEYLIEKNVYFRYSIVKGEFIDRQKLRGYLRQSYQIMKDAIDSGWNFTRLHKFCDLKPNELSTQTCGSGFSGAAIYVDGGVYYCHVQFGQEKIVNGTLHDKELDLVSLIEKGKGFEGMKAEECSSCNYKHICTSGCPMYRENGKDPNCSIYHEFIPYIFNLQAQERLNLILKRQSLNN